MVRVQAANEHFLMKLKSKRRTNSVEDVYTPNKISRPSNEVSAKSKMMVSRSQPEIDFQAEKINLKQKHEEDNYVSDYSEEAN